jgi:inosose dehydratase
MVDFEAALAPIAEAGYNGWVICEAEQDPAKAHPLTYAKKGYATLKAVTTKLGFEIA